MADHATPNLPSRDFGATAAFYAALGFEQDYLSDGWMILARGEATLEFFPFPILILISHPSVAASDLMICLR